MMEYLKTIALPIIPTFHSSNIPIPKNKFPAFFWLETLVVAAAPADFVNNRKLYGLSPPPPPRPLGTVTVTVARVLLPAVSLTSTVIR